MAEQHEDMNWYDRGGSFSKWLASCLSDVRGPIDNGVTLNVKDSQIIEDGRRRGPDANADEEEEKAL